MLCQPVVSVFKPGKFSVVLRLVSECTATQVAGVVSIRCGLCSTGARQTSVAIKSDKGFCVHSHIPQPPDDTQATAVPVNDRVSSLVSDTARLAHYSADTREQLLTLADQVHHKLNHLEEKLHRVDQVQRAQLHLEQIFSWWSAGRYASFSPAGRCYVALEELRWGAFGDVIRQSETGQVNQLLDILRHKALTQMAQESGGSATVRLNTLDWLGGQGREQADNEWHDAINWLGDWCSEEQHPVIWSTTQAAEHLPVRMPRLCSAERLSESMVDEIFQKGAA